MDKRGREIRNATSISMTRISLSVQVPKSNTSTYGRASDEEVQSRPVVDRRQCGATVASKVGNETSSTGYALGYGAAVLIMLIAIPLLLVFKLDLRVVIVLCGAWWFCFSLITFTERNL